jgi:ribosomal protein S18 acetylase RimI-like enzyme
VKINYKINTSREEDVLKHLLHCDSQFLPQLSQRVSLELYSKKISENGVIFEAWANEILVGMVAIYLNDINQGYITNVSVYAEYGGRGIAKQILNNLIEYAKKNHITYIKLEVNEFNIPAVNLYKNFGFEIIEMNNKQIIMLKKI